ncbi:MAG: DNA methyltransferase [Candidatus Hydrogenedentes bacterium]|nr:DNA methyltransferase [Candidatus Hydrogenedentota bacterium]
MRAYLKEIERQLATGRATEHTHRAALQRLLESQAKGITATNEPTRIACGAPDFIVAHGLVTVGYVEAKDIGANLDEVERSEQLKRYFDGLPNLILTNYLEFRMYHEGEYVMEARLALMGSGGKLRPNAVGNTAFKELCQAFLNASLPTVATPHNLAQRMAGTARILRDAIQLAFNQEDKTSTLHGQLESFRKVLLHDLEPAQFADMYAQTICYGLFAARCNHKPGNGPFTRQAATYELPETNPFLRKMFGHIAGPELDSRLTWAVDHLSALLHHSDIGEILRNFGRRTRQEDPVVHFYETFLAAYDQSMREARGVYYTPEPVVSFIVRSVDKILKRDFGIKNGLAAHDKIPVYEFHQGKKASQPTRKKTGEIHKVLILDPAAGTGTFLHGVIDHIHEAVTAKSGKGMWDGYVAEHLLPRIFGFELLMAPYAVAHMKLGIQLAESGYSFQSGERLRVYLTNMLEEAFEHSDLPIFAGLIADEASGAGQVKAKSPVMVILGNPPYSGHSLNKGEWIAGLMRGVDSAFGTQTDSYFEVDGQPLGERNPKWLNDDYVKFIRFAQWRIEQTGYGILAFITNHGYLDNPTFRGMRRSILRTFDDIYIVDLHGNSKRKETAPDGSKDENVFDIQQGVAIGIFVKRPDGSSSQIASVRHADMWGVREAWDHSPDGSRTLCGGKYAALYSSDTETLEWTNVTPLSPTYLFVPQDNPRLLEYEAGWSIVSAMPVNSVGIATARDRLAIHMTPDEVWKTVSEFVTMPVETAREHYGLGADVQDWKVHLAQEDVLSSGPGKKYLSPILYRPFDRRWTYYTAQSRGFLCRPRPQVMRHMQSTGNLGLATTRSIEIGRGWEHVFCTRDIVEHHTVSLKEVNYLFPLYLYPKNGAEVEDLEEYAVREEAEQYGITRKPNLSPEFLDDLSKQTKLAFVLDGTGDLKKTFGPEDVFHYIYAVLHSPGYRERYAEFLKRDFARVPLTSDRALFRTLCELGARLVKLHLLDDVPSGPASYPVTGGNTVEKPRYVDDLQRVYINDTQYFDHLPRNVWDFHVGGYRVCEKWLKDRKGRSLGFGEREHYLKAVSALGETIQCMRRIDAAIEKQGGWPLA